MCPIVETAVRAGVSGQRTVKIVRTLLRRFVRRGANGSGTVALRCGCACRRSRRAVTGHDDFAAGAARTRRIAIENAARSVGAFEDGALRIAKRCRSKAHARGALKHRRRKRRPTLAR